MNKLSVGFSRMDITPMRGIGLAGYYNERRASKIRDNLNVSALAIESGEKRVLLISLDLLQIQTPICNAYRRAISEGTGIPFESIFLHCTHTHTAPYVDPNRPLEQGIVADPEHLQMIRDYQQFVKLRLVNVCQQAIEDLKPAKMGYAVGDAPNISFIRRYRMKDGSVRTNPGRNNPDVVAPMGEVDTRVNLVRFDREGGKSVALVNFGNHPDVIGGSGVSADWPGFLCKSLEQALDDVFCIFFNGAQGDVNHVCIDATRGWHGDMLVDFSNNSGYAHAKYMGRFLAGSVLQIWDKVCYTDVEEICVTERLMKLPSNMPTPEQMPEAHRINDLHMAGRDDELPYKDMMLVTVVAEAGRMVALEHGPEFFEMPLIGLSIGNVALVGIPGEPFNGIGLGIKEAKGWDMIMPCCLVNGCEGYFPMKDAYDEGGYEARSSNYKAGTAEQIIEEGKAILASLRN